MAKHHMHEHGSFRHASRHGDQAASHGDDKDPAGMSQYKNRERGEGRESMKDSKVVKTEMVREKDEPHNKPAPHAGKTLDADMRRAVENLEAQTERDEYTPEVGGHDMHGHSGKIHRETA